MDYETPLSDLLAIERMIADSTEELERTIKVLNLVTRSQVEILKAFSDLYIQLTSETQHRKFLDVTIRMAEREAARTKIPLWFWRPEKGLTLRQQLERRARWLFAEKYVPDDVWDLLVEFVRDWAKAELNEAMLSEVVQEMVNADAF